MPLLERICQHLELAYQPVEGIPALNRATREDAISYLLSQGWIADATVAQLTTGDEAAALNGAIAFLRRNLAKTDGMETRLHLIEQIAKSYENMFLVEIKLEEQYLVELQFLANKSNFPPPEPPEPSVNDDSDVLETELQLLRERSGLLQQQIKELPHPLEPDRQRELTIELADIQKGQIQVEKRLLFNRQAQALRRINAPKQAKKKRLKSEIDRIEAKKFVNDLMLHSLDRISVLDKIRLNLRKAISNTGVALIETDTLRQDLFLNPLGKLPIDWL